MWGGPGFAMFYCDFLERKGGEMRKLPQVKTEPIRRNECIVCSRHALPYQSICIHLVLV